MKKFYEKYKAEIGFGIGFILFLFAVTGHQWAENIYGFLIVIGFIIMLFCLLLIPIGHSKIKVEYGRSKRLKGIMSDELFLKAMNKFYNDAKEGYEKMKSPTWRIVAQLIMDFVLIAIGWWWLGIISICTWVIARIFTQVMKDNFKFYEDELDWLHKKYDNEDDCEILDAEYTDIKNSKKFTDDEIIEALPVGCDELRKTLKKIQKGK